MRIEGFYPTGYTSVPHSFIDRYMAGANGEFVKTYLLLLRVSEGGDFSVPDLADKLQQTEKDVQRAIRFWASQGLLRVVEKGQEIESVFVLFPPGEETPAGMAEAAEQPAKTAASPAKSYSAEQLKKLKEKQDFDQLLFALEHYLGRTLTPRDVDIMAYLYDGLGFSGEVLEYLAEYCVDRWEREEKKKDHHLMRYMEKVALNWHSQGVQSLEQAKKQTARFALESASYIAVAKAKPAADGEGMPLCKQLDGRFENAPGADSGSLRADHPEKKHPGFSLYGGDFKELAERWHQQPGGFEKAGGVPAPKGREGAGGRGLSGLS